MKKWISRFILILSGAAAAYMAAVRLFFNMIAEPKSVFFKNKFGKGSPYEKTIQSGMNWLKSHPKEEITIESFDGQKLSGYFFHAKHPERTLLMCHGWRGRWFYDFAASARWFYEQGCNLLIIEERAQGSSEGAYIGMGILERKDCHSWVDWLSDTGRTSLPVYLCGVSMGASTVLMAAGEPLPGFVKGIIADCGFTNPYEMVLGYGKRKYRIKEHPVMDHLNHRLEKKAGYNLKEYSTLEAMKNCQIPVLFIHGKADDFVPCEMTLENYKACQAPKELLLVEGAGHCMSFLVNPEGYKQKVAEFFARVEEMRI